MIRQKRSKYRLISVLTYRPLSLLKLCSTLDQFIELYYTRNHTLIFLIRLSLGIIRLSIVLFIFKILTTLALTSLLNYDLSYHFLISKLRSSSQIKFFHNFLTSVIHNQFLSFFKTSPCFYAF